MYGLTACDYRPGRLPHMRPRTHQRKRTLVYRAYSCLGNAQRFSSFQERRENSSSTYLSVQLCSSVRRRQQLATLLSRSQGGTLLTQLTAGEEARSSPKRDQVPEPGHPGSPEKETSRIGCRLSSCRAAFEGGGDKTRRNYGVSKQVMAENPGGVFSVSSVELALEPLSPALQSLLARESFGFVGAPRETIFTIVAPSALQTKYYVKRFTR